MRRNVLWILLSMASVVAAGCAPQVAETPKAPKAKEEAAEQKHDHDARGKHGGQQQLLGNHEYHAELAHNEDAGEVALYVTDAEFKPVAVPEKSVFLTVILGGQPKEFTLAADAKAGDQPRFVLVDKQLCEAVCDGKDPVRLNATLKGKPYAATYTPGEQGGHEGHEHAH